MNVSLRWLADYVDIVTTPEDLAERLTMAGTEVGAIKKIGETWGPVFVGQITRIDPHPNADRLSMPTVNYGPGKDITVVTGAQNIKVGQKVPLALLGARLIDGHSEERKEIVLKPIKLRGVESLGMLCSALELGLMEEHAGIYILDPETPVGVPLVDVLGDTILELELTTNRSDLLSMIGVAREVAALTNQKVRLPVVDYPEQGVPAKDLVRIDVEDPKLCPRYTATIITGLQIKPSPDWMQRRLVAAGMRPISNIVDVTNYLMLEWGQPLHAFDYDKLQGQHIIVRNARPGEELVTLDGQKRELTAETLMICDERGPVAVAGVMGGLDTEVTDATTTVLLESASFNQTSIRRTARRLRLQSEASKRFERGLPAEQTLMAGRRATQLMLELGGGTAAPGVADTYPVKQPKREFDVPLGEFKRLLGCDYPVQQKTTILENLGFEVKVKGETLHVVAPEKRVDISIPADVVEEVARVVGYDSIPTALLRGSIPEPTPNKPLLVDSLVRRSMVGLGFTEIIAYALTSRAKMARLLPKGATPETVMQVFGSSADGALAQEVTERLMPLNLDPLAVMNPLSVDAEVMRTTALSSMLETLATNLRHTDRDIDLFEVGRIYLPRENDLPEERRVLTAVMSAYRTGRQWGSREENDFFDLKGAVEELLDRLGITDCQYVPLEHPVFQPGRAAVVVRKPKDAVNGPVEVLGAIGEVNDRVLANFDVNQPAYLAGFDLGRLAVLANVERIYTPLPRFPAILQDIAVVVDEALSSGVVHEVIERNGGPLLVNVSLFDVYRGAPLPEGKKSLAYHIAYQAPNRTLTDSEVGKFHERIRKALAAELKATFRD
jgi:phenylalanyl-tRNA synthetase beta chain